MVSFGTFAYVDPFLQQTSRVGFQLQPGLRFSEQSKPESREVFRSCCQRAFGRDPKQPFETEKGRMVRIDLHLNKCFLHVRRVGALKSTDVKQNLQNVWQEARTLVKDIIERSFIDRSRGRISDYFRFLPVRIILRGFSYCLAGEIMSRFGVSFT
jgi:hypothetical protein